jgi:hypothetical protein
MGPQGPSGVTVESDPIFTASEANFFVSGDKAKLDSALQSFTETDPVFALSVASGISSGDITNWNTAFGWGNHAAAGYLTSFTELDPDFNASEASLFVLGDKAKLDSALQSFTELDPDFNASEAALFMSGDKAKLDSALQSFTETDPIFSGSEANLFVAGDKAKLDSALQSYTESDPIFVASAANGIIGTDITNWNTAFGWGNHATVGYLTTESDPVFTGSEANLFMVGDKAKLDSALQSFTETDPTVDLVKLQALTSNDFHSLGGVDADTTYSAGTGLVLTGTVFSIDGSQFSGWDTNAADDFTTELDPVFTASAANGIDAGDITNWDAAFGWGNHAIAGYLTTELDPAFSGSEANLFVAGDKAKLDSAVQTESDPTVTLAKLQSLVSNDFHNLGGVDANTTYTAGNGLTLTGTEFSINPAQTQARVSGTCAAGSSIRSIATDGTVTCETDDGSGYERVTGVASTDDENAKSVTATCTGGKKIIGGGYLTSNVSSPADIIITSSYPSSDTVWTATGSVITGGGDQSYSLQAFALCATMN